MSATKDILKALCRDPKCKAALCFSRKEEIVQCFFCGQQNNKETLLNIQEVSEDEKEWVVKNLVRRMQVGLPKRNAEFLKVLGLSNYYCKLLSPLLTHYGMDNKTSQAKLLCDLNQGEILDCSVFCDRAFLIAPHHIAIPGYGRDVTGSMIYLNETLRLIKSFNGDDERLIPIHTDGDGHCLVHAISRALVGRELFWHPLRCALKRHFQENLDKYKELFKDFIDTEEWTSIIEECDPDFKPPDGELHGLRNIHIFGLANVLKRPIILLDSLDCMKKSGDYSALFLPGFVSPEGCRGKDNSLNKPICIAWSSFSHNHYIPLVGVQSMPLPVLPMSLVPKAWGIPQSQVLLYIENDSNGNCVIGGNRSLSDNYIQRLVTAMEGLFYVQNRVHPSLVADAKLFLCQNNAFVNTKVSSVVDMTRTCVQQGRLYRCHSCNALAELRIDSGSFRRGGLFYSALVEIHQKLEPDTPYIVNGINCKYDPIGDTIVVDLSLSYLECCTWCNSKDVHKLNPNGTECESLPKTLKQSNKVTYSTSKSSQNFRECNDQKSSEPNSTCANTKDTSSEKMCNTSLIEKKSEQMIALKPKDTTITIKIRWNKKVFEHVLSWTAFQNYSGENLNNAILHLTSDIIKLHFPEETNNSELAIYVEQEIRHEVEKFSSIDLKQIPEFMDVSSDKWSNNSIFAVNNDTEVYPATAIINSKSSSDLQYVKVVSPKGDQINLPLREKGITYEQLRMFIKKEFDIPVANQKIKMGFPPKELEIPVRNNHPLPLKHGDRLTVENCPKPINQKLYSYANTPFNRNIGSLVKENMKIDTLWKFAITSPNVFKKDGLYYENVMQTHIVSDMEHVTIDCFPFKSFSYNKDSECLELCMKGLGHFEICQDLDSRIDQAKHGQIPKGFRKCSMMTSKDPLIVRTMKKVIPVTKDTNSSFSTSLIRKGPGFSILRSPEDDMDVS